MTKITISELEALLARRDFEKALQALSGIERVRSLRPRELVIRSRCIQLSSGANLPPLEEAERALQQALEEDDEYIPAILDLAWYYHAVEDDPAKALPLFERAYELSRQNLTEAITGKAEALEEVESLRDAVTFLRKALRESVRLEDFDEEKKNWVQSDPELSSTDQ